MKLCPTVIFISLATKTMCFAQTGVGIGINNPDNSAVLHVESTTQGILIPRHTTSERTTLGLTGPTDGILVYDITIQRFCFWNGSSWMTLNTIDRPASTNDASHTGNLTVSGAVSSNTITANSYGTVNATTVNGTAVNVTGTITATNYALNATGNGPIPRGGIIMWSGTTAPTGWALCNGDGGTPDLRGQFIVGYNPAAADYDDPGNKSIDLASTAGETGGLASVTLNLNQMPSHDHSYRAPLISGDHPGGSGGYSRPNGLDDGTTGRAGGTTIPGLPIYQGGGIPCAFPGYPAGCNPNYYNIVGYNPPTYQTQPFENRPPYYVLAYIIKL
jgi:hypothetical protein